MRIVYRIAGTLAGATALVEINSVAAHAATLGRYAGRFVVGS